MIERWHDRLDGNKCECCGHCVPECHVGDVTFARSSSVVTGCPNYLRLFTKPQKKSNANPPAAASNNNSDALPDMHIDEFLEHLAQAVCEKRFSTLNWPVKFPFVPVDADFLHDSDLFIVADCAALIVDDIYCKYIGDGPAVMLCPRMQEAEGIAGKICDILTVSHPKSLTILRMEVPCCNGLNAAAARALELSGIGVPFADIVVSLDGAEH